MARRRLKHVVTINDDALPETTPPDTTLRYIDISAVGRGKLVAEPEAVYFGTAPTRARRLVRPGDTIISTVRTYLRAVWAVEGPTEDLVVSTGFAVLRPAPGMVPRFLGWVVQSAAFVEEVVARSQGISYPSINVSELADIRIPFPTLSDQQRAADELDVERARVSQTLEELASLRTTLDERFVALREETVGPSAWGDWPVIPAGRIFEERDDPGLSSTPMLAVTIARGIVLQDDLAEQRTFWQSEDAGKSKAIDAGDIAYNKMRMWQGAVGVAPVDGRVSSDYVVLRGRQQIEPAFFEMIFRTRWALALFHSWSRGIADDRNRLYWEDMKALRFPCPPLEVQREVVARLVTELERVRRLKDLIATEERLLAEQFEGTIASKLNVESGSAEAAE